MKSTKDNLNREMAKVGKTTWYDGWNDGLGEGISISLSFIDGTPVSRLMLEMVKSGLELRGHSSDSISKMLRNVVVLDG